MLDYRKVISKIDLRTLIAPDKVKGNTPVMLKCFWHDDTHPSMAVYPSGIHCFGCGRSMSTLEWVAEQEGIDITTSFSEVVEIANSKYAGSPSMSLPQMKSKDTRTKAKESLFAPMKPDIAIYAHEHLGNKREWYLNRGISNEVIDTELLGYLNNAFAIPIWDNLFNLVTIRYRRDDAITTEGAKYWGTRGRNSVYLFNVKALSENRMKKHNHRLVICEGELDTLRLWSLGIPAVSYTNGVKAIDRVCTGFEDLRFIHAWRIYIAFDQDEPGKEAAEKLAKQFPYRSRVLSWDIGKGKDVTELVNNLGKEYFKHLILEAERCKTR